MDNLEYFNIPGSPSKSNSTSGKVSNKGSNKVSNKGSNLKRSLSENTRPPLPPKTSNASLAYANLVG